eukprot:3578147-Karenia_brevis.AAC.1
MLLALCSNVILNRGSEGNRCATPQDIAAHVCWPKSTAKDFCIMCYESQGAQMLTAFRLYAMRPGYRSGKYQRPSGFRVSINHHIY